MHDISDVRIWSYNRNGEYNVKTKYHLQRKISIQETQQQQGQSGISEEVKKCCSALWKLNLPPKFKTFWWRVAHNSLAVTINLNKRGVHIDDTCQSCGEDAEI